MLRFKKYLQEKYQLTGDEWSIIQNYVEVISLPKYEYFVQKGKVCRKMAFVAHGVLRFCMERDGLDITCYFASENNFVGDPDSFFTHRPSDKNIQALTNCELIGFGLENFKKMHVECPRFEKITQMIDHDVMMGLMSQRDFIQHAEAAVKYQKFLEQYPQIIQRVPLGYIASFLGITQQSLSRLRKQLS